MIRILSCAAALLVLSTVVRPQTYQTLVRSFIVLGYGPTEAQREEAASYRPLPLQGKTMPRSARSLSFANNDRTRMLYVVSVNQMADGKLVRYFEAAPYLQANSGTRYLVPSVCDGCPDCERCFGPAQIAPSYDGRQIHVALERLHRATSAPPPGVVVFDNDASVYETRVFTFDMEDRRFLPGSVLFPDRGHRLQASRKSGFIELVQLTEELAVRSFPILSGNFVPEKEGMLTIPASTRKLVSGYFHYLRHPVEPYGVGIRHDGVVVETSLPPRILGSVGPIDPDREIVSPVLHGHGNYLVVPSGPNPYLARKTQYIDLVETYEYPSLKRIRSQRLQRPLTILQGSPDGSRLYALSANNPNILELNAETLWQEAEYKLPTQFQSFFVIH